MKRHFNLYQKIISESNIIDSALKTISGKGKDPDCILFKRFFYKNIRDIIDDLNSGTYKIGNYINFTINDPKPRNIVAVSFRDRILQRAIFNIIEPLFDKTFLNCSYACRKGKGTHSASNLTKKYINKGYTYYLKTDFSKYFKSIDRKILWELIDNKIGCQKTKELIGLFLQRNGVGINIGELLSQLFANLYGNQIDYYIHYSLNINHHIRYMDDMVIFGNSYEELLKVKDLLEKYIKSLNLNYSKWHINILDNGINFVGYINYKTHRLIRKDSVKRAKKKLNNLSGQQKINFINSWLGHIRHANCYNLIRRLRIYEILLQ